MSEKISMEYGFRRPDGKVQGWWPYKADRDRQVNLLLESAKKLDARGHYRVRLLERETKVVKGDIRTTGAVRA